jgi:vacuolar-type H+-ATPase subunit F/Vma7
MKTEKIDKQKVIYDFEKDDCFERKKIAQYLTKIIDHFYKIHDEAYVLSLNAPYGSGKTYFLKKWQKLLADDGYKAIYVDAWGTDYYEDPIIAILEAIQESFLDDDENKRILKGLMIELASTAIRGALKMTLLEGIVNLSALNESLSGKTSLSKDIDESYKISFIRKEIYQKIKSTLSEIVRAEEKPIYIFIDELDRARPDYAISFLEAIKHVFSVQGLCFVLAVNREQLEKSTKHIYGDITFDPYYLRFVTYEYHLPTLDQVKDLEIFLDGLYTKYKGILRDKGIDDDVLKSMVINCAKGLKLTGRDIESFYRHFSTIYLLKDMSGEIGLVIDRKLIQYGLILMLLFRIKEYDLYQRIGQVKIKMSELHTTLKNIIDISTGNEDSNIRLRFNHKNIKIVDFCILFINHSRANDRSEWVGLFKKSHDAEQTLHDGDSALISAVFRECGLSQPADLSYFQKIYKTIERFADFYEGAKP